MKTITVHEAYDLDGDKYYVNDKITDDILDIVPVDNHNWQLVLEDNPPITVHGETMIWRG